MKRRLRRERSEISEHRGKEGDRKKESSVLDEQGRTRNEEKKRKRTHRDAREGERKREEEERRERRRCRDYHIMVPRGRISCATT